MHPVEQGMTRRTKNPHLAGCGVMHGSPSAVTSMRRLVRYVENTRLPAGLARTWSGRVPLIKPLQISIGSEFFARFGVIDSHLRRVLFEKLRPRFSRALRRAFVRAVITVRGVSAGYFNLSPTLPAMASQHRTSVSGGPPSVRRLAGLRAKLLPSCSRLKNSAASDAMFVSVHDTRIIHGLA